jgi:glycosyltransferase involved in cell wall biosynthesis
MKIPVDISFCIPTFSRATFLDRLLDSINLYEKGFSYEVRVQDNCSTDHTKQIFHSHSKQSENWFYEKNIENLGGKVNIYKCTEKAQGTYILIIGDDDYFNEESFGLISIALNCLKQQNDVKACYFNTLLQIDYSQPRLFTKGFEWLEVMGINAPAFISSVIWEANYWKQYNYYDYIKTFHLPQLDCFVGACINQKVIGFKKSLVVQTKAEDTNNPNFWFYKFHAYVDCFEYPMLYNMAESNGKMGFKTRFIVKLRRIKLLKEIFEKISYFKQNEIEISITDFAEYHKKQFYWPILYAYLKMRNIGR